MQKEKQHDSKFYKIEWVTTPGLGQNRRNKLALLAVLESGGAVEQQAQLLGEVLHPGVEERTETWKHKF